MGSRPYERYLKPYARQLRKQGILSEAILWKAIKNKALGVRFNRQLPVFGYIVDFCCIALKLVIEVDGSSHNREGQAEKDRKRQQELEATGITVIRYTDADVRYRLNAVLESIQVVIAECQSDGEWSRS